MDCDDVILLLARGSVSDSDAVALDEHVAGCDRCAALVIESEEALAVPTVGPTYLEVGETIATGGMGKISRAFDRRLGREVALKEVLSPSLRARFEREAAITARLQHPAIIPIYDAGTWADGTAFYTMRLVPGETLTAAIDRRSTLPARLELLPHVIAVSEALAYAHSRGVIHRDLKPQNILIGEFGETVVIDWGLAKTTGVDDRGAGDDPRTLPALTHVGTVVGTPCFMAPEQARGDELDERADVFALGALLYNLLAGAPPYWDRSHDSTELIDAVLAGAPTPIVELAPSTPADLRAIVERAMARDPAQRYADARELAAELSRFQAGQLLLSREYRIRDLLARWVRKHRALVAIGTAAIAALAIVATFAIRAERARETAFESGERRGQRKLCATSSPLLADPWTAEARDLVHRKFAKTSVAFVPQTLTRVDAAFARWSTELATTRDIVCGNSVPRPQLAAELDCLADRTREARALIGLFQDADKPVVLNAIVASEQLTPPARCTVTTAAPVHVVDSTAVRDLFSRSHALLELGKARDALPITQQAMTAADATGDLRLRAAAHVALGAAQASAGMYDDASATLQSALRLADTAHDDRSRAQAWTNLVRVEYQRGRAEQAVLLQSAALGAAERIGDVYLQTETMLFIGGALGQLGKNADAQALFERAVALRRATYGPRDRRVANALSALGNAYAMKGNLEGGITAHREAVEIAEAALGDAHPNVGVMHGNLGSDYLYGNQPGAAIVEFEKALAIAEGAHGGKHREIGIALTNLGTARYQAGEHAAALELFARAEVMWREVNPKQPTLAEVYVGRYLAQQALGKPANAAELETAVELGKGLPPFIRARAQLALGKSLRGPRAIELVTTAAAGFATSTLPLSQREHADAKAWLAEHGVP